MAPGAVAALFKDKGEFEGEIRSAAAIPLTAWNECLQGRPEDGSFYLAAETVPPSDAFKLGAVVVRDRDEIVALSPLFEVAYRLDTPLQGTLRRMTEILHTHLPLLINVPVLALGSPLSDTLALGFAARLSRQQRVAAARRMIEALEAEGVRRRTRLLAVKGVARLEPCLHDELMRCGFNRVTSVPEVIVDLPYANREDYLDSLPEKTAGYLRRKARAMGKVQFEDLDTADEIEPRLHELMAQSVGRSSVDYGEFEKLNAGYFSAIKRAIGDRALLTVCRVHDKLVGFQFSVLGPQRIVTKQIGIAHPDGRELNLYFLNWLRLVDVATARGLRQIELGGTTYKTKLMLGGRLERRWLYYKIANSVLNRILKPAGRLLDFERNDPELQKLPPEPRERLV